MVIRSQFKPCDGRRLIVMGIENCWGTVLGGWLGFYGGKQKDRWPVAAAAPIVRVIGRGGCYFQKITEHLTRCLGFMGHSLHIK